MKLYASPLACSGAAHIVLLELALPHTIQFVDIYSQPHALVSDGSRYTDINPKDAVPALRLESGELLTEVGVVMQYLADLVPGSTLLAPQGTMKRYRVQEWLSFVGSDIHKSIGQLFNPRMPEVGRALHRANVHRRLSYVERHLESHAYLTGDDFTIADAYLFVMIGWAPYEKVDIAPYPNLQAFHARIAARPSVRAMIDIAAPIVARMPLPDFALALGRDPSPRAAEA